MQFNPRFEMYMKLVEWVQNHPTATLEEYHKAKERIRKEMK